MNRKSTFVEVNFPNKPKCFFLLKTERKFFRSKNPLLANSYLSISVLVFYEIYLNYFI